MHIALIFDFEIGKKNDTKNYLILEILLQILSMFFFGLFWDKLSRELSLESFKFIDRLLTFDF